MTKCSLCNVGYLGYPKCSCPVCGSACQVGFGSASSDGNGNPVYKSCTDDFGSECHLGRSVEQRHACASIREFLQLLLENVAENQTVKIRNNLIARYLEVILIKDTTPFVISLSHELISQCQNISQ